MPDETKDKAPDKASNKAPDKAPDIAPNKAPDPDKQMTAAASEYKVSMEKNHAAIAAKTANPLTGGSITLWWIIASSSIGLCYWLITGVDIKIEFVVVVMTVGFVLGLILKAIAWGVTRMMGPPRPQAGKITGD